MLRLAAIFCALLLLAPAVTCGEESAKKAPTFSLTDLDKKEIALDDLLGKGPVVIDFWATWCKPCIKSLDHVRDMYKDLKEKGLEVIAVNEDDPRNVSKVKPMVSSHRWNFIILLDANKQVKRLYHVAAFPTTFVLDHKGNIRHTHIGYTPGSEKELREEIEKLLLPAESEPDSSAEKIENLDEGRDERGDEPDEEEGLK